jgi:hypothetical protein
MTTIEIIRVTLKEIASRRHDVVLLAARQRAKFEGWLKFELAAALSTQSKIQNLALEKPYSNTLADLAFEADGATCYVEIKTANFNWRAVGVENKTRPVTKNISGIIEDIRKLRRGCPPAKGVIVFVLFPIPTRVWEQERDKLLYHLQRIENEGNWPKLIDYADFVTLDREFGVALFTIEVV